MAVFALIPAAGMGRRMNAGFNKQYILLAGIPIVARTIDVFQRHPLVDHIVLVTPEAEIPFCRREVVEAHALHKVRAIVAGGSERQHSVLNGLRALPSPADDDIVVIHDGVRPFVDADMIRCTIDMARLHDGALVAVPAKDTIKVVQGGTVRETPPRETLWLAQTPQTFRYGVIRRAHEQAASDGHLGTDDASLVERAGGQVVVVMGDYRNIKITTPEDMLLGEAFLKESAPFPQSRC
jgi:2-C-methyl-D-erythritol 4-phosphate cytidylyltransferase